MSMDIRAHTRQFVQKDNRIAALSYFGTFAFYFTSFYLAVTYAATWWILLPMCLVMALSAVRLYVLQHDCGHASLFETRKQNELAGHGLSVFTFAPFEAMKQNHNEHHGYVGNLDHREAGEINTMTLREWNEAGFWERLAYRLYRNPFILIPLGALFTYFIRYRWPKGTTKWGVQGVILHNIALLAWVGLIYLLFGWTGIWVWLGSSYAGGMFGVWLVYLQHNFEDTYWDRRPSLDPQVAALQGSSCLDFGWFFDFLVAGINLHDIHHFNARIPSYRLRECHYSIPEEYGMRRIKFPEAIRAMSLKLWDEDRQRLVPFPPARETRTAAHAG